VPLAAVVAVLALCAVCTLASSSCKFKVNKNDYDLSSLSHIRGDREILYKRLPDGSVLYVNFCEATTVICPNTSSVCLLTPDYKYAPRGEVLSLTVGGLDCEDCGDDGLTATFVTSDFGYKTRVHLVCADNNEPVITSAQGSSFGKELEMIVKTKVACASAMTVIPSLLLVVFALLVAFLQH